MNFDNIEFLTHFDTFNLNDEFITKLEECIKFEGVDSNLIATKFYNFIKNYKLIKQLDIKNCDIDFNQLIGFQSIRPELLKLIQSLKELDYSEFELVYYNIINILPFYKNINEPDFSRYFDYKSVFSVEMFPEFIYKMIQKLDMKTFEPEMIDQETLIRQSIEKFLNNSVL